MPKFKEQDSRTVLLFGEKNFNKLQKSHVLIVGAGGVGGYAAEQLARAGVGELTIVDADVVNESNLNRQIIALQSTVGFEKIKIIKKRLLDINPEIKINTFKQFLKEGEINQFLQQSNYNYVIDAIDTLRPKVDLLANCYYLKIPVVSSMGAGGKMNPEKVMIADIEKTYNCKLARMVRKRLHKLDIRTGFKAVFSSEEVIKESVIHERSENKATNTGTVSYMPAIFGIYCASVVIQDIISS